MNTPKPVDELRTIPQTASALGKKDKTIRQWCWRRDISFLKIGHNIYIRESTIQAILDEAERPAVKNNKRGAQ
jgi:hypothetical protein